MRIFVTLFIALNAALLLPYHAIGQTEIKSVMNRYGFQYGFSLKLTVELGFTDQLPNPIYRLSAAAGVGSNFLSASFHPSVNSELQLYNGGIGSRARKGFLNRPVLDWITAFTVTGGWKNQSTVNNPGYLESNIPLYYFADFVSPPLKNPFNHSLSIGTNLIFSTDRGKESQRVGFLNVHINRVQFSYYNDGGIPIYQSNLGDRRDRYYTGGVVLSYHGRRKDLADLIELSFHKYTGYTRNAFELSNKMYLAYMDYYDTDQKYYNKSVWSFTVADVTRRAGISAKAYNYVKSDLQHKIHWGMFNTFHLVPYKPFWSISAHFYQSQLKAGIQ